VKGAASQRGFALVAALGLIAVLSLAALLHWQADHSARQRLWLSSEEARAVARIEAGSAIVLAGLAAQAGAAGSSGAGASGLERLFADGATLRCQPEDLAARLNVNALLDRQGQVGAVQRAAFTAVLAAAGIAPSAVDALADRLDGDEEERTPWGAEAAWYRAHRPRQAYRNGPMSTLEELAEIRGFPPDVAARLAPWLTVLPAAARLNINTAATDLLAHIDPAFSRGRLAALVAARPFRDLAAWQGWATAAGAPSLPGLLDTRSHHHAIDCRYTSRGAVLAERLRIASRPEGGLDFLGRSRLGTGRR